MARRNSTVRKKAAPEPNPDDGDEPVAGVRHQQISDELRQAIIAGKYPVDSALPTEADLCTHYGVSRHSVRAALQRLVSLGMVERRQGAGTRVISGNPKATYIHTLSSLQELFEYTARDVRRQISDMGIVSVTAAEAADIPASVGSRWLRILGVRSSMDNEVICYAAIFVHARFAPLLKDIKKSLDPIYTMIEARSGEFVAEAVQEISARAMPAKVASALKMPTGTAALRFIRRYLDSSGGAMLTSINWHPADHCTYLMRLKRDSVD
jgi:GntR family transcriptional regulator